jgi:glycosyltransferase involved in cell wall biosynthesis
VPANDGDCAGCATARGTHIAHSATTPLHSNALSTSLTILHLLAPAPVGGLQTVVATLAAAQRRGGHHVVVAPTISAHAEGEHFLASLEGLDLDVVPLDVSRRAYLREAALIGDLCRTKDVNIVHTHGYRSDLIGGHAGHAAGIPIVTTVHGFTGGGWKNRAYEALERLAFRRFDAVVAVSRPMADGLRAAGVPESKLRVVPNALAPHRAPLDRAAARRALGLPDEVVIAGWVGRVSREKGVDAFVDAVAALEDCRMHAAILGDGPERMEEEDRSRALAPTRFFWPGVVPDAPRYLAAFDMFVLSSRAEGMPMVLLEAMAAGVPIVTTNVGGIPDMLSPDEAILVPPDDPAALAAAMRATRANPAAAAARASAAQLRQLAEFAVGPWSARYAEIYRELLAGRAPAGARA